jgi:hypothetical protein
MAQSKTQTINQILASSKAAQQELYDKELQLKARREKIKDTGYDGPLTPAQIAELKAITASQGALAEMQTEISVMTVTSLNQSAEVTRLVNVVTAINEDLKGKLDQLNAISKTITGLGNLFKQLANVITGLGALAALF